MLMSSDVMRCLMFVRNPDTWQPGSLEQEGLLVLHFRTPTPEGFHH